ncbi:MAG: STAS domain-containing protein [Gammaproteobacteria bacterium]|nr:MAG: STAS domain-containing protein [Gammaproteobacteria bacterium]
MNRIELPRALTIQYVENLRHQFDDQPADSGLTLDASGVEVVDTLGIQLLLVLARRQTRAGGRLTLVGVPDVLVDALRDLGLDDALPVNTEA